MSSVAALLLRTMVLAIFAIVFMGIGAYFGPQVLRQSVASPAPPVVAQGSPSASVPASATTTATVSQVSASASIASTGAPRASRSTPQHQAEHPSVSSTRTSQAERTSRYIQLDDMTEPDRVRAYAGLDEAFCQYHQTQQRRNPQAYANAARGTDERRFMRLIRDRCDAAGNLKP